MRDISHVCAVSRNYKELRRLLYFSAVSCTLIDDHHDHPLSPRSHTYTLRALIRDLNPVKSGVANESDHRCQAAGGKVRTAG